MSWRRATPKPLNIVKRDEQLNLQTMTSRGNTLISFSVLCIFWVFAGYLNYLLFRFDELGFLASTALIGQNY